MTHSEQSLVCEHQSGLSDGSLKSGFIPPPPATLQHLNEPHCDVWMSTIQACHVAYQGARCVVIEILAALCAASKIGFYQFIKPSLRFQSVDLGFFRSCHHPSGMDSPHLHEAKHDR